jgi:hypothetical protein
MKDLLTDLEYAGSFSVDSGQAMVGDPCYLSDYDPNTNDAWSPAGKEGQYSYQGVSATTLTNNFGLIADGKAVAFSTGYGDGSYPVYVKINQDGRVSMVVIDFEGNIEDND